MKKKDKFNLLVDISDALDVYTSRFSPREAEKIKEIFGDRYEVWPYVYNAEQRYYELDQQILELDEPVVKRFDRDPRLKKVLGGFYFWRDAKENLQEIRHFPSVAAAQLVASVEGFELFIPKKNMGVISYITFGEILKKWRRLA